MSIPENRDKLEAAEALAVLAEQEGVSLILSRSPSPSSTRIDAMVAPGRNVSHAGADYDPSSLTDPALRRA
jgi:hypothetical protein